MSPQAASTLQIHRRASPVGGSPLTQHPLRDVETCVTSPALPLGVPGPPAAAARELWARITHVPGLHGAV